MNRFFSLTAQEISKAEPTLEFDAISTMLEFPPDSKMGDVAFPCFKLSKTLRKAPQMIAAALKEKLEGSEVFSSVNVEGGYLNFFLNRKYLLNDLCPQIGDTWGKPGDKYAGKTALVEHTSINPNASPHIGRGRNALIGDAIVRLLRFLGYDTTVHYFVNDIGKQISLLVWATKDMQNVTFSDLLGIYVKANDMLKDNPEIEAEVFNNLNALENGDENMLKAFRSIVDVCIKGQSAIFNELGIFYDKYDYESRYITSGRIKEALDGLQKSGRLFEDEQGRMVLNLEEFKINSENPYLPLTRGDKTSLYPLRDICYSIDKSATGSDVNIVVLGEDQRLYGRAINAAIGLLGYKPSTIVNYAFVLLPDGAMHTREGKVVLLEDLMKDTVESAAKRIVEKNGTEDIHAAKVMGYGAIKYSILKCGNDKNVLFDKESSLAFTGDTSVYLQYSYARIASMLSGESMENADTSLLDNDYEWDIVKQLSVFPDTLENIAQSFNFSPLTTYLFNLAQKFSRWYTECPIKKADDGIKQARLKLASMVANVLRSGLNILGIEVIDKI